MASTTSTPSEHSHKLKTYLHKLHLPLRTPSNTTAKDAGSGTSASAFSPSSTATSSPPTPEQTRGDDSILENRIKISLSGDAKPGSHPAYFCLTPDGSKHVPTYVDASEVSRAVEFEDGSESKKKTET